MLPFDPAWLSHWGFYYVYTSTGERTSLGMWYAFDTVITIARGESCSLTPRTPSPGLAQFLLFGAWHT
jgi:hypothetical protein